MAHQRLRISDGGYRLAGFATPIGGHHGGQFIQIVHREHVAQDIGHAVAQVPGYTTFAAWLQVHWMQPAIQQ